VRPNGAGNEYAAIFAEALCAVKRLGAATTISKAIGTENHQEHQRTGLRAHPHEGAKAVDTESGAPIAARARSSKAR
jgi:hypothetical protein